MSQPEFPSDSGYPESSEASMVLGLGILGMVFNIVGPVAWILGNRELAAIDEGRRNPENRGTANAGRILGIIGTVFLLIGVLFIVLVLTGVIDLPGATFRT